MSGQSIARCWPSTSRTVGRVAWKSTNSSGSITAKRSAPRPAPRNVSADEADSPASFQPLKAHTSAGARSPSGRRSQRSGCIRDHGSGRVAASPAVPSAARTGSPYLALELRDRTSALPARVFRDADLLGGRFDRGDLVRVNGRVERFRDELQVEVRAIERAEEADPAAFLPVAYRNLDELDGFLEHLAREVHDPGLRALLDGLLEDATLRAELRRAPCTRAGHHAYLGGLLEHTVAVAQLAVEACALHPRLNSDLLITAAIVHDLGKTREFTYGADIGVSDEGRLLGHVELGLRMLEERAAR